MARSSRSFTLATKEAVEEARSQYEEVEFELIDPDEPLPKGRKTPVPRIVTARFPGEGAMMIMAASVGMSDAELANPAGALFGFLRAIFSEDDYKFVHKQIRLSRLDIREQVLGMVAELMEAWSGVPTQQ
jgi:hypothetical protein